MPHQRRPPRVTPANGDPSAASRAGRTRRAAPLAAARRPRSPSRRQRHGGRAGQLRQYGLLVYALPILMVLTVVILVDTAGSGRPASTRPPTAAGPASSAAPGPDVSNPGGPTVQADGAPTNPRRMVRSAVLPTGGPFPKRGSATFRVVPGVSDTVGRGRLSTYTVEVENGIRLTDGEDAFARAVQATLSHPKSWTGSGRTALRRVDAGTPNLRVTLASQATARSLCGFDIPFDTSCFLRDSPGHVVLNAARWERGAHAFQGDIGRYRRYLVNHETGHFFNNPHQPCAADGGLAPLMMQQTLTTSNDELAELVEGVQNDITVPRDGKICRPNEWAFPNA